MARSRIEYDPLRLLGPGVDCLARRYLQHLVVHAVHEQQWSRAQLRDISRTVQLAGEGCDATHQRREHTGPDHHRTAEAMTDEDHTLRTDALEEGKRTEHVQHALVELVRATVMQTERGDALAAERIGQPRINTVGGAVETA